MLAIATTPYSKTGQEITPFKGVMLESNESKDLDKITVYEVKLDRVVFSMGSTLNLKQFSNFSTL